MKTPFSYTVLRYMHDIFTGEFVNVGIVVYAPKAGFLKAKCTTHSSRASAVFPYIDSAKFRSAVRFASSHINRLSDECFSRLDRDAISAVDIAKTVIPIDHSSLQWSRVWGGVTDDPEKILEELYNRFVAKYEKKTSPKKDEVRVWKPFENVLRKKHALSRLQDITIEHGEYDWHFEHAWKNGRWNVYQPVSFDLVEKRSIIEKAANWGARVKQLRKADVDFKIYLLLGKPKQPSLLDAFGQAQGILAEEVPGDKEIIREEQIPAAAEKIADQILHH